MKEQSELLDFLKQSIAAHTFVKMTISSPIDKQSPLLNVYVRYIEIKGSAGLSFTYRYKTNDQIKNWSIEEGIRELQRVIGSDFKNASLFTTSQDYILLQSKKGLVTLQQNKPTFANTLEHAHDRQKVKRASSTQAYLMYLGITDANGILIQKMADKYRQINKYLEIIEGLIESASLPEEIHIVDMGSGKGYLTFALYDYLSNEMGLNVHVTGIELRDELVDYCNDIAQKCGFENLYFVCKPIQSYTEKQIDILIALHACDTATDDAIYKGIVSNAQLIVCAPCCHKQIRQQLKGIEQESPILKYGIFKERQFEMVTDTIRALILEQHHYQTKVFEFISNEHTRKNVMLVGSKIASNVMDQTVQGKIDAIKKDYHIDFHYLEKLIATS
jgi:SAM-dependent methyltransferase